MAAGPDPRCLLCGASRVRPHFYPPNRFREKTFRYYRCLDCGTLSICPVPEQAELDLMYGVQDHPELPGLASSEKYEFDLDFPRFSQESFQLRFLEQDLPLLSGRRLLDFACGNGFYLAYARKLGLDAVGVEYDPQLAGLLRDKTDLDVLTFGEFQQRHSDSRFDVVHLGHVLEHLPNPAETLERLKPHAHARTVFVVDGPLEYNGCLARWAINLGSRLKAKSHNDQAPQHLTLSTYASQLRFFQRLGFQTLRYEVAEQYWPLPDRPEWRSASLLARHFLARLSIALSSAFPRLGNLFHYAGTRMAVR